MRKVSRAPRPTGSLPAGHTAPEAEARSKSPKLEPKQPTATYHHFLTAARRGNRRRADFYAQKCRDEGLPEAWLKELALLDGSKGAPTKALTSNRRRGRRPEKFEKAKAAMLSALGRGEITPDQLDTKEQKELEIYGSFSRDTLVKARQAALSEFVRNSNSDK